MSQVLEKPFSRPAVKRAGKTAAPERMPQEALDYYGDLARTVEAGKTINVSRMSKEDRLKLIRR